MITYITAFIFYTFAMIGIILIAYMVYKKTSISNKFDSKSIIKIIDSVPIGNKKNLLIVKIQNEKFLIASGLEHTTFLAKLSPENKEYIQEVDTKQNSFANEIEEKNIDTQENKLNNIQQQFQQLYAQENTNAQNEIANNKREMVRNLIRELNKTTSTNNIEGRF